MDDYKRGLIVFILLLLTSFISFLIGDQLSPLPLPSANEDFARVVVDEHGRPLRAFADSQGVWRYQTRYQKVSAEYIQALLHYEDRWFYYHPGVNPLALIRALFQNTFAARIISGGSTITMQVARIFDPHQRSYPGKFKQAFRAFQLEWHFTKEEILNFYLNYAPFGGPIEGVAAASYVYLDKAPDQLTHAESALLAVLPQRPSFYRPDRHADRAQQARDKVLNRMKTVWSEQTILEAKQEPVEAEFHAQPITAALFSRFARQQQPAQSVIQTTLNLDLQMQIEDYVQQQSSQLPRGTSIAVLIVNHQNMQIKAYVGSADFSNEQRFGHVDMIQATRSPGSTLKPFLYGIAIDEGLIHSKSLLSDAPRQFGDYQPNNFSGGFNGPVSVTQALQRSLNIPAVQVLQALGTHKFSDTLHNAGIKLDRSESANLSMILGGTGTSLWQLVKAYSALANQGKVQNLLWHINDKNNARFLLSEGSAWIIRNILQQQKRIDQLNLNRTRLREQDLAWKTGTSYGFRDAWAIGINNQYTLGVWVGRPDSTPVPGYYGSNSAAPLLIELHNFLADDETPGTERKPDSVSLENICWPQGTLTKQLHRDFCHKSFEALLLDEHAPPTLVDKSLAENKNNPFQFWINEKGERVQPSCEQSTIFKQQVAIWPLRVEPWIESKHTRQQVIPDWSEACKNQDSLQDYRNLQISSIIDSSRIIQASSNASPPAISLKAVGGSGKYQWYINGLPYPENSTQDPSLYQFKRSGHYQISVVDKVGNTDQARIEVIKR